MPLEGRTEADGTFVLGGATAPAYRLYVQAPGFAPLTHPVDAPSEGVELVLEAAGVDRRGWSWTTRDVRSSPSR